MSFSRDFFVTVQSMVSVSDSVIRSLKSIRVRVSGPYQQRWSKFHGWWSKLQRSKFHEILTRMRGASQRATTRGSSAKMLRIRAACGFDDALAANRGNHSRGGKVDGHTANFALCY